MKVGRGLSEEIFQYPLGGADSYLIPSAALRTFLSLLTERANLPFFHLWCIEETMRYQRCGEVRRGKRSFFLPIRMETALEHED